MSGFSQVLKKNIKKDHIACAVQSALPGGGDGPAVQNINAEIAGFIPALAANLGTQSQFGYGGNFGYDTDLYPVVPTIEKPINKACGTGSNETSVMGTLVIDPKLPPGSSDVFDLTIIPKDISAGMGSVILFCPTTGQYTAPQGSYGGTVNQVRTISGLDASSLNCPIEDVLVGFLAFGANGNALYEGNCDEICDDVGTIVAVTPSACDPARECFKDIFGCYPEEMSLLEDGLDADDVNNLIANYIANNNVGGLTEAEVLALVGPHLDLCPAQAIVVPPALTFVNPQIHRRGYRGEDTDAARCDHTHERRRINPTPLRPDVTFAGTGTMDANLLLREWSDDTWVAYQWRVLVSQDAGTGWGYVQVPNIAGFQRPKINVIGTYRIQSTAVQDDGSIEPQSRLGASPRGPYMGQEAHHWSGTQRIYAGFFRRDNAHRTYIELEATYICL